MNELFSNHHLAICGVGIVLGAAVLAALLILDEIKKEKK